MKNNNLVISIVTFVLLVIAQITIFGWLNIYNYAFCFAFITYIISNSPKNGLIFNLFIAFVLGLIIDKFNYSLGINAFCCVVLAYIRNSLYGLLKGQNREEQQNNTYTISGLGIPYFSLLVVASCFIYSMLYFFLSAPEWLFFGKNVLRALGSTLLSSTIIISINVLFLKGNRAI